MGGGSKFLRRLRMLRSQLGGRDPRRRSCSRCNINGNGGSRESAIAAVAASQQTYMRLLMLKEVLRAVVRVMVLTKLGGAGGLSSTFLARLLH